MEAEKHTVSGASVLIVDDHRENLVALTAVLDTLPCQVVTAASGSEALRQVRERDFAVILLDVLMPGMNGFETATLIRQHDVSRHVPLIFLTAARDDTGFVDTGYSVGAVDYLVKPINPAVVRAKVGVFVDLYCKALDVKRYEAQLRLAVQQRGDEALRETQAHFAATFEEAPIGIGHTNLNGEWLRVNQRACSMFGYSRDELLRLRCQDLAHPDEAANVVAAMTQVAAGDVHTLGTERRFLDKAGGLVWVNLRMSPLRDAAGQRKQLIVVLEQISERKRAEENREFLTKASEVLLSSLDHQTILAHVSRLAVPHMGDSCMIDVTVGTGEPSAVSVHAFPERAQAIEGVVRSAATHKGRVVVAVADRNIIEVDPELVQRMEVAGVSSLLLVPLSIRDHAWGTIAFASVDPTRLYDATDMTVAEDLAHRLAFAVENARLYDEAQQAIRARDDFLSIASHELRTPLTPLQLQLQRLVGRRQGDGIRTLPPERFRSILDRCERQVQRLGSLVDNLLDVSRIRSGRLKLHIESVDLGEIAREVFARFSEEASRASCELELEIGAPVLGRWDRLRLEQVTTNLLANAMKYGAGHPIHMKVDGDEASARLEIRDHGIGIPASEIRRIFERFERGVSSRSYGGLGLGLYITQQIVDAHGGTIRVESTEGAGSTFTVNLPLRCRAEAEPDLLRGIT